MTKNCFLEYVINCILKENLELVRWIINEKALGNVFFKHTWNIYIYE